MPSEKTLTQVYGVSRVTVRRALEQLVEDGFVSKHHGQGTVVNLRIPSQNHAGKVRGLLSNLVGNNIKFSAKTLVWKTVVPTNAVSEKLEIAFGEPCLLIQRVRYVSGDAISYVSIYLPGHIGQQLDKQATSSRLVLDMLDDTEFKPDAIEFGVSAALADGEGAKMLALPAGSAALRMQSVARSKDGTPVYFQDSLYHPDRYEYCGKFERDSAANAILTWRPVA